ncbi:hypothetical protein ACPUYX_13345 [Desulfosporosinus sp. SYSU MS00001]|uniref:hypothetical protein n=1 Tax=Desulfosporosinus sp. SYSU MS00001 TaxID=3416284 RepID=UPI003CF2C181
MGIFFPLFITPTLAIMIYIPFLVIPIALIVWFMRKFNNIEKTLCNILAKLEEK